MIQLAKGIDVSHHQGEIGWPAVESDPEVRFAIIRTGHGVKGDRQFRRNWRLARKTRLVLGVYHYFDYWVDAQAQAQRFLEITDEAGVWDGPTLPPVGDFEHGPITSSHIETWLNTVEGHVGLCPWIYTGPWWWNTAVGNVRHMARYPLWVADYTGVVDVPLPWTDWIMHQRTDKGRVRGIGTNVDVNAFNGDDATLHWMAGSGER